MTELISAPCWLLQERQKDENVILQFPPPPPREGCLLQEALGPLWCGSWGGGSSVAVISNVSRKITPSPWEGRGSLGDVTAADWGPRTVALPLSEYGRQRGGGGGQAAVVG